MSLLAQTIQEYLKEEHPEWAAGIASLGRIYIDHRRVWRSACIFIDLRGDQISFVPSLIGDDSIHERYTEATILPQISKFIKMAKV